MEAAKQSPPFSVRLPPELDELVSAEARRTKRSRGAVVRALTEEALRTRMFPGICFTGPEWSRRASVVGSGWDVWQVVAAVRDFHSEEKIVDAFSLTDRQVRAAMKYADHFPAEISEQISDNERPLDELARDFPFAEVHKTA